LRNATRARTDRSKEEHAMPVSKLDPIDRKILAELQADGRMTNVE